MKQRFKRKGLRIVWQTTTLLVLHGLLPVKWPAVGTGPSGEDKLLITYSAATCAELFPKAGLEAIERRHGVVIETFEMTGRAIAVPYETLINTDFVVRGRIEGLDQACGGARLANHRLLFAVDAWQPTRHLARGLYSNWLLCYFPLVVVVMPALIVVTLVTGVKNKKEPI